MKFCLQPLDSTNTIREEVVYIVDFQESPIEEMNWSKSPDSTTVRTHSDYLISPFHNIDGFQFILEPTKEDSDNPKTPIQVSHYIVHEHALLYLGWILGLDTHTLYSLDGCTQIALHYNDMTSRAIQHAQALFLLGWKITVHQA